MLVLRPSDLPGLHDPDVRRDALPGVRAGADQGADDRAACPGAAIRAVTEVLIAINVVVFLAEVATGVTLGGSDSGWVYDHGALLGVGGNMRSSASARHHQYWRLLTSGFLHASLLHIGLNMLSLCFVGRALEPAIGELNFAAIYFSSLLAGSFGALLFEPDDADARRLDRDLRRVRGADRGRARTPDPDLAERARRRSCCSTWCSRSRSPASRSAGISAGWWLGASPAGWSSSTTSGAASSHVALAGCAAVAVISVIGAIAVAGGHGLTPNGFTL